MSTRRYSRVRCFGKVEHSRDLFVNLADSLAYERDNPCRHQHVTFHEWHEFPPGPETGADAAA